MDSTVVIHSPDGMTFDVAVHETYLAREHLIFARAPDGAWTRTVYFQPRTPADWWETVEESHLSGPVRFKVSPSWGLAAVQFWAVVASAYGEPD